MVRRWSWRNLRPPPSWPCGSIPEYRDYPISPAECKTLSCQRSAPESTAQSALRRYTCNMKRVDTPQTRCRAGVARGEITPPVGIYHRMWGAAVHDRATGIHRPLMATLLWLEPLEGSPEQSQLVVALDQCLL